MNNEIIYSLLNYLKNNELDLPHNFENIVIKDKDAYKLAIEFYYKNHKDNKYKITIPKNKLYYTAQNNDSIAKGTCFKNIKLVNFYKVLNNGVTTFRFGFPINNINNNHLRNTIINKIDSNKKLILISLITPCKTRSCQLLRSFSNILPETVRTSLNESKLLQNIYNHFNNNDYNDIFLSVPLSRKKYILELYRDHLKPDSDLEHINEFEKLIDISTIESTFKTIVDITELYYNKYRSSHFLCFHCRSGKDRTSVFDSVVQATILYLTYNEKINYKAIRDIAKIYLMVGYIIAYYSTGKLGLKLNNIPVAKYILESEDELYRFYKRM